MRYDRLSAGMAALQEEYRARGPLPMLTGPRSVPLSAAPTGGAPLVDVFVQCDPEAELSKIPGLREHETKGTIRTASVPLDKVDDLSELPGVRRISPARLLRPLDLAAARTNLGAFRASQPGGLSGAGVIVGIVDTGIDSSHPAFAGRILSVWDQTIPGTGWGTTTYGNVLTGGAMSASLDLDGHGTHVAGIAAGADPTFEGVAPGADLVIVKTNFSDTGISDAARYIFHEAHRLGRPAVVNLSLGGHWDAHDGSDDLSANLDTQTGPGRLVVAAAGNEGFDPIHAGFEVPAGGTFEAEFRLPRSSSPGAPPWVVLNGWYAGSASLEVALETSAGDVTPFRAPPTSSAASPTTTHAFASAFVRVTTPMASVNPNGDHQFQIEIFPGPTGTRVQGGTWRLRLRDRGHARTRVDVWSIVPSGAADAAFLPPALEESMKIGSPAAAASAIAAASYTTRNVWTDVSGTTRTVGLPLNDISTFSSPGPLRDGAEKPDVAAPGAMIASARSAAAPVPPALLIAPGFMVMSGTSMACPYLAGLLALMLQRDPGLDPATARAALRAAVSATGSAGGGFDPKWGFGLIDAALL